MELVVSILRGIRDTADAEAAAAAGEPEGVRVQAVRQVEKQVGQQDVHVLDEERDLREAHATTSDTLPTAEGGERPCYL